MIGLSEIIAGTMTWGNWGKNLNTKEMVNLIQSFVNQQITTFDHADIYGSHTTETEFGAAFKISGINRTKVQHVTKCGIKYPAVNRNYTIKHYDYSKKHIKYSVEQSLKNLQTDYIDVLLLHRPSPLLNAAEVADTITELKQEGKILDFGLSNFNALQTEMIAKHIKVNYNQIQFSLTHFEAMNNGELDFMQTHQIKPMAWNPLGNVFKNNLNKLLKTPLENISNQHQTTSENILLAWLLKHSAGITPVVGTTNLQRIENLKSLAKIQLETEDWFVLYQASLQTQVP